MKMDAMGIVVADMAATLAFYRAMGLDIPPQADAEAHVEVTIAEGFTLMLDTTEVIHSFAPDWKPGTGTIALAFGVDTPAEVDANYHRMVAAGYRSRLEPFDAWWGQRYASLYDPDGNGVDIAAPLPPTDA